WKTIEWDLTEDIQKTNWGQTFGCGDWLQIQFLGLTGDQMMWIQNPRWINSANTGIDEITYTPERPADNRIFNLMGIECKGDLAPGIYIQNGKKFIVK
ncbi:MAG: hypothetical protein K2K77_00125, partial [Duncaniella sp.]|nr:hypothetical protein [Duncaniella sp.]